MIGTPVITRPAMTSRARLKAGSVPPSPSMKRPKTSGPSAPAPMPADTPDPAFARRYRALSNGVEPNAYAVLAYDAARLLCDAIARDVAAHGRPTRAGVAAALRESNFAGLSGAFRFDASGAWAGAPGWVYGFEAGQVVKP